MFRRRFFNLLESVRTGYWFVPAVMSLGAALTAWVMLSLDAALGPGRADAPGLPADRGADAARSLLSAIAASVITVAGTVFSITIVALTLATTQFGPRLLRQFMIDRGNQVTLGAFTATFLYCLIVLGNIEGSGPGAAVPRLAVGAALALALLSVGVLIYFIHHVSTSIHAGNIVANVAAELEAELDRLFPEEIGREPFPGEGAARRQIPPDFDARAAPVAARANGYIRLIDEGELLRLAERHDLVARLKRRPGQFVARGENFVLVYPPERLTDRLEREIRGMFVLGNTRTPHQDAEFALNQLVEIAVRALSPSLNDPFTAVAVLDWVGVCLRKVGGKRMPSPFRTGPGGRLRVIAEPVDFGQMVHKAFEPIRQYGAGDAMVAARLLDTIASVAPVLERPEDRAVLLEEAERIRGTAAVKQPLDPQRSHVDQKFEAAERAVIDGREPVHGPTARESAELG